jgi:Flp pilus assembly protein TadG
MSERRTERGAAAVETALCICFIVLPLVLASISYAFMFSFRQTLSQSATEGARAAAVAPSGTNLDTAAKAAIGDAMRSAPGGMACGDAGLECEVTTYLDPANIVCPGKKCVTVKVSYPYREKRSIIPLIGGVVLPKNLTYSATAEVN